MTTKRQTGKDYYFKETTAVLRRHKGAERGMLHNLFFPLASAFAVVCS